MWCELAWGLDTLGFLCAARDSVSRIKEREKPAMRRFLPALVATALLTTGCEMLTPGGKTIKACRENLISNLKDRESYRQDSDPKVIQEEPDQPKVWGWYYNAKNSMGGYGDGSEVLCYQEESGRIIQKSFGVDDPRGRRMFLSLTSPKIQKEIADEVIAAAKAKADQEAKEAASAARRRAQNAALAAEARRIYNRNYSELIGWCNAKARPDSFMGEYGWVENFDLSQYRMEFKLVVNLYLKSACRKMNEEHTNSYGDKTPAPQAFNKGLVEFSDKEVESWAENRSAICKVEPQFCR